MIITSSEDVEMYKKSALEMVKIGLMAGDSMKEQIGILNIRLGIPSQIPFTNTLHNTLHNTSHNTTFHKYTITQ